MTHEMSATAYSSTRRRVATRRRDWRFAAPTLLAGLAGLGLASHFPLLPWAMSAAFIVACALFWAYPRPWLIVFAVLPLVGLAPWTGWITFEESDLLVLAVVVGVYGRLAVSGSLSAQVGSAKAERHRGAGALAKLTVILFAISAAVSMVRGFADAGGFEFGWYQGYHEPLNSLRVAKPFFLALLLWPLWRTLEGGQSQARSERLSWSLMLGLLGVGVAAAWERAAYTGLLDFSTEYRTTALFWEMHVGGAAIDGALALMVPFAVNAMLVARSPSRWAGAAVATLLGGYACLSTFSRAVYLAIPVSVVVLLWLQAAQRRRSAAVAADRAASHTLVPAVLLVGGFAAASTWLFPTSGYRGLLALLGVFIALLMLANLSRRFRASDWLLGFGAGAILSGLAAACAWTFQKGAYAAYAVAGAFTLGWLGRLQLPRSVRGSDVGAPLALAGFVAMVAGLVLVGWRWGEEPGLSRTLPVAAILLAVLIGVSVRKSPAWPASLRWQGTVLSAMAMVASVVGVFGGGSYMADRFARDSTSLGGRLHNWRLGLAMLDSPFDWAIGKGLGRFPASYALSKVGTDEHPGDYRLASDAGGRHLVLSGGTHALGWLAILRFSQRVPLVQAPASVRFDVRTAKPANLMFEVCEKHLLYSEVCLSKTVGVEASGQWQTRQVELEGKPPSRGAWYAPKLIVFSVGVASEGAQVELDNLALTGPGGSNLLANGSFGEGLAHWYFTSDGYHTPWHIEGILMNALFDQGVVGAGLLIAMLTGALWRLSFGSARNDALAPPLAAALVGFVVVGLFSSVTDVPRVAFLFYFLLLLGLTLRGRTRPSKLPGR